MHWSSLYNALPTHQVYSHQVYSTKMNTSEMFPSKFFKAKDIEKPLSVVIESIKIENLSDGTLKPCLYFKNQLKLFLLNRTNCALIENSYGSDTDNWIGKTIMLILELVPYKGETIPAIRVRIPPKSQSTMDDPPW